MVKEYDFEEFANQAIEELNEVIDPEKQLVKKEKDLVSILDSWNYVILHIDERIPQSMEHLIHLNLNIGEKFNELINLVESGEFKGLKIIEEEEKLMKHLEKDVKHRNWRAVRENIKKEENKETEFIRLEKSELKHFKSKIIEILDLIKKNSIISAIEEDLTSPKEKEKYGKLEEYYFAKLYRLLKSYEQIFDNLWKKELVLYEKVKKDSGKAE